MGPMKIPKIEADAVLVLGNHLVELVIGEDLVAPVALKRLRGAREQHVGAADGRRQKNGIPPLERLEDVAVVPKDMDEGPAKADDRVMVPVQFELAQAPESLPVRMFDLFEPRELGDGI